MIKNEHLYLDEWINYHLNIGVDHLFIFEDIDSDSHKEITNKYDDKVSLNSVLTILQQEDTQKVYELKKTHRKNPQHIYFKRGLSYIKQLDIFDWCFIIDVDEFITLQEGSTLNGVFSLYKDYDAFIMKWDCFGANGYIAMPDYTNCKVIDTFTQRMKGIVLDRIESHFKTCYNLNNYSDSFFFNQHHPTDACNWCNTNLAKNYHQATHTNIYVRHYITKSWEEYLWKLQIRGFPWGGARSIDFFFKINPDLMPLKAKLLENITIENKNTSCILTFIKNEHEYLDEWIKYHLDLGISHIFIFEDFDSKTHKDLVRKYRSQQVTLNNVLSLFKEEEKQQIMHDKLNGIYVQDIYAKRGLKYITNKYSDKYMWCFFIDNDEFITFENKEDTLDKILSEFVSFDAVLLQWKNYGSNNLIYKPDYTQHGIIDTYIKEAEGKFNISNTCLTKTCYNLKNYKDDFYWTVHQPSENCAYCKTNFEKDRQKFIYDKIFLRHYVVKSWEEFVWKTKVRGRFGIKHRNSYDSFFDINPSMISQKQELIHLAERKFLKKLIVLPYTQCGAQGDELKIALYAWEKYCKFSYHFVVIGDFKEDLKKEFPWVDFIYVEKNPKKEGQYNPNLDTFNKMYTVYTMFNEKYDGFIRVSDDCYAIKPFDFEDINIIHYHQISFTGNEKYPTWYWCHDKWKTRQLLDREGLPHVNYSTHMPYYIEFDKFKQLCNKYNMLEESYVVEDIYFNHFPHKKPTLDSTIRLGIWSKDIYENEFQKAIDNPNIKFVCNSVEGWSKELEESLKQIVYAR